MKCTAIFVFVSSECSIKALIKYQIFQKTCMMRKQKLLGYSSKRYDCIYGNLSLIIGGQRVSCQNVRMETYDTQMDSGCQVKTYLRFFSFLGKRVAQLPLEELNFLSQFNFSLALPDIVVNKTLGESALPGKFFSNQMYPSHLSLPLALVIQRFCFSFFFQLFFIYVITREK